MEIHLAVVVEFEIVVLLLEESVVLVALVKDVVLEGLLVNFFFAFDHRQMGAVALERSSISCIRTLCRGKEDVIIHHKRIVKVFNDSSNHIIFVCRSSIFLSYSPSNRPPDDPVSVIYH